MKSSLLYRNSTQFGQQDSENIKGGDVGSKTTCDCSAICNEVDLETLNRRLCTEVALSFHSAYRCLAGVIQLLF